MAGVTVVIPSRKDGYGMSYTTGDGFTGPMHRASSQFDFENVYGVETMEREGMKPITRHSSPGLRKLSFTQLLGHADYQKSIEPLVAKIVAVGERGTRIRFSGGSPAFENGRWWMITGLGVKVAGRAVDNSVSRVLLSWDLTEYVAVPSATSVVRKPAAPPKPVIKAKAKAPVYRYHRVVSGDTLWHIARRYLGNALRWPEIYRLNTGVIRNPDLIYPGQNFKIPGR